MGSLNRGQPRVWITHVTGLMADDDHCHWAAWYKARYTYKKAESDFDTKGYRAKHKLARNHRVEALKAEGWDIRIEDAVKFEIRGTSVTLAGKPDIVAFKHDERRILVSDAKTGKKYLKHWYQVVIYMKWIRKTLGEQYADYAVAGELAYFEFDDEATARLAELIQIREEELTPEVNAVIVSELQTVGMPMPPERSPSELECLFCDITRADCKDRIIEASQPVDVKDF